VLKKSCQKAHPTQVGGLRPDCVAIYYHLKLKTVTTPPFVLKLMSQDPKRSANHYTQQQLCSLFFKAITT